ncbi:MAG: hypothetical protein Q4D56_04580, partial [Bacteroides sp.]|nr:hypothetical protein [Bacteroides sp.]
RTFSVHAPLFCHFIAISGPYPPLVCSTVIRISYKQGRYGASTEQVWTGYGVGTERIDGSLGLFLP